MYLPNELAHPIIIYPIILDISVRVRNLKKKIKKKKIRTSYFISMIERLIFLLPQVIPISCTKEKIYICVPGTPSNHKIFSQCVGR